MKDHKLDRKWTTGRSRVERPTNNTKYLVNTKNSIKVFTDKFSKIFKGK